MRVHATAFVMAIMLCGCNAMQGSALSTVTIPLKVWRMHGSGDIVGGRANSGCRLTDTEIYEQIRSMQRNAALYSANLRFTWNGTISNFVAPAFVPFGDRFFNESNFIVYVWLLPDVPRHDDQSLNIYFVGNYQDAGIAGDYHAATLDPQAAWDYNNDPQHFTEIGPFLVMNDGGRENDLGFFVDLFGFLLSPTQIRSWAVAEHELTHYFGRFNSETFGAAPSFREYNVSEHADEESFNILLPHVPDPVQGGCPLYIPNMPAGSSEFDEIDVRIKQGGWNDR